MFISPVDPKRKIHGSVKDLWLTPWSWAFLFYISIVTGVPRTLWADPLVVIDAANGGTDTGVEASGETAKSWNLRFAQILQSALSQSGVDVLMLRKGDETLSLEKRAQMADASGAAAVLVIETDREWTGTRQGAFVVVEPPTRTVELPEDGLQPWGLISIAQYRSSLRLAKFIAERLGLDAQLNTLCDSRGSAGEALSPEGRIFCVPNESLRYLSLPSVVIFPMFLTSNHDLKNFSNSSAMVEFCTKVAQGLTVFLQGIR